MKILFIILICGLQSIAQNSHVTFGRYGDGNGGCTSGRGVCSFSIIKNDEDRTANATVNKIGNAEFSIRIPMKNISNEDQVKMAGMRFSELNMNEPLQFLQDQDLVLNAQTLIAMGISSEARVIASGKYTLEIKDDYIQIFFTLKSQK